jgi:hypothetical protein
LNISLKLIRVQLADIYDYPSNQKLGEHCLAAIIPGIEETSLVFKILNNKIICMGIGSGKCAFRISNFKDNSVIYQKSENVDSSYYVPFKIFKIRDIDYSNLGDSNLVTALEYKLSSIAEMAYQAYFCT